MVPDKFAPGSNVGGWRLSGLGVDWHFFAVDFNVAPTAFDLTSRDSLFHEKLGVQNLFWKARPRHT